ncbi:hypothetical protein Desaci_4411 [Desulfosporosinus acidiphilus SJ4]|uniref:DUF6311 domain-containing protein n=1 Tax=Desulfosporosinus acidiphilus (strain DSM 22704 / JCM 16185 / SJ4) TaxID=646529 RepID=I4DBT1_DESAJ|nr:hypothetical protein Desaci_4411 [Desulfosporosinus acidiphilus SJ4]
MLIPLKTKPSKEILWVIFELIIYVFIAFIFMGKALLHPFAMQVGGGGDSEQAMWFLGSFWNSILHGQNPFISRLLNYPGGINLMAVTSILAESFLIGPIVYLCNTVFAYNLLFFINMVVSCYLGNLILYKLGSRRWMSVLGGGLFGLMPYLSAHSLGHANLLTVVFLLAIIYMSIDIINKNVTRPLLYGFILGFIAACQFYTSLEVFATAAMILLILLGLMFINARDKCSNIFIPINIKTILVALGICTLFILPGIIELFWGPFTISYSSPIQPRNFYVNDLLGFILPTPIYLLHGHATTLIASKYTGNVAEQNGYLGLSAILLLFWAAQRLWKRRLTKILFSLVLISIILSMGPYLHILGYTTKITLPWILIEHLPLLKQALPSRLMLYGDVGIIILIILALEDYLNNNTRKSKAITLILLISIYLTWLPIIPFPSFQIPSSNQALLRNGAFYDNLKGEPTAFFTSNFNVVMEALADGRYAFPVVNLYGYAKNTPAMTSFKQLLEINDDSQKYLTQNYLAALIRLTKAKRVIYIPRSKSQHEISIRNNLEMLLGKPLIDQSGIFLWKVPNNINAVWFDGEVWDNNYCILNGKASWCGKNWSVNTSGQDAQITITAPPKIFRPQGISLKIKKGASDQSVRLKPDESIKILLNANSSINFSSEDTFIPDEIIHNGDKTHLSVQMAIDIKPEVK